MMKTSLWFGMLALVFVVPVASGMTELEILRLRCSEQEQQISRLEEENLKLRAGKSAHETTATAATSRAAAAAAAVAGKTHKIQQGETYASIARKYGVAVDLLVAANPDAKPTALRPGQVIRLSANSGPATPPADPAAPLVKSKPAVGTSPQEEDAAESPKPANRVPEAAPASGHPAVPPAPASLKKAESPAETSPDAVKPPVSTTASQPATPAKKTPAANSLPEPASVPKSDKKTRAVTIDRETTYGEFAAKHGTNIKRLNDLNGLDLTQATILAKGSELYLPAQP